MISGFTFIHNYSAGYPLREAVLAVQPYVDEIVAVDMQSSDNTRQVLTELGCRVIDGKWGHEAETTLGAAHALHTECKGDVIIHFEADEVWDKPLIREAHRRIMNGEKNILVNRIQIEQNFMKLRWGHHKVHRVFPKGGATKDPTRGHTTKEHDKVACVIGPEHGLLFDCTYCFRDQWKARAIQNAELWGEPVNLTRCTPDHFLFKPEAEDLDKFLADERWEYKKSPFDLPDLLKPLVGLTRYV